MKKVDIPENSNYGEWYLQSRSEVLDYYTIHSVPKDLDTIQVHSYLIDWNYGSGTLSMVAYSDTTCNIYMGSGSVVYGNKNSMSQKLILGSYLDTCASLYGLSRVTGTSEVAELGYVHLYFVTDEGLRVIKEKIENINNGTSSMGTLFSQFKAVLSAFKVTSTE